jgi:DNA adenine methylase
MKTLIRYYGNKSRYISQIKKYLPTDYNTYIEPFIGSGSILLALSPNKWIINDLNNDLIGIYNQIKNNPKEIETYFKKFGESFEKMSNKEKSKLCREITDSFNLDEYDNERYIKYFLMLLCSYSPNLIIRNKYYFQSLNLNFTATNSYYFKKETFFKNLNKISEYLQNGHIYNKDYKEILKKAQSGDFCMLDPPYIEPHDYYFKYNKNEKVDDEFVKELLTQVKDLDKRNVKWLMTQSDTEFVRNVFKDYNIHSFKVYRNLTKKYTTELIITNYKN